MKKTTALAAALGVVLFIAGAAQAQTTEAKAQRVFTKLYPYSVAAEIGAILFDGATSAKLKSKGYGEAMPLFRDADGNFSAKRYYGFNSAMVAGKLALGRFFPRLKPYLAAINFGMSAPHVASGVHNMLLPRRAQITLQFQLSARRP